MHFTLVPSTGHGINYLLFSGSLLGHTLPREIKESTQQKFLKQNLEKQETFLAHVLCVDKDQRRIQNPVGFNDFKPLTVCARSYFLEV